MKHLPKLYLKSAINLSILLSISIFCQGQNCDPVVLAKKTGIWKQGIKGSTPGVLPADLTKEKTILANIHQSIANNYQPIGCQVLYSNAFSGFNNAAGKNWVADNYQYHMYILPFLCDPQSADKSKFYIAISTPTTVNITANAIWFVNSLYAADLPEDDMRGYLKLKEKPQLKDGAWFFGEEVVGDYNLPSKITEQRWLITYNNQLPFSYVSRKEYLNIQKTRLEKTISQESGNTDFYNQYMNRIKDFLKKSEAELNVPAICMWNDEERFEGFVEEGTKGSFIAIKPNSSYYNKKLSRSVPQFFSVSYKVSHGNTVFEDNVAAIQKAINFSTLANMLGKEAGAPVTATSTSPVAAPTKTTYSFDVLKNEPTAGFKSTPVSELKTASKLPASIDPKIKAKALSIQLNSASINAYVNDLFKDVEKNLSLQEQKNVELVLAKSAADPISLADLGGMLYYKNAVNEALYCLSKAASLKPGSDYILSNLSGIMNLAGASPRALPILKYLNNKKPGNTTVLNNLGQALFALGEIKASKSVLDSCIRLAAYHPQANFTRAIISETEGDHTGAVNFIQKSLKGAYSDEAVSFANKKGAKLDYRNILSRRHLSDATYINARNFIPPPQCKNVNEAAALEKQWEEWQAAMQEMTGKINGLLSEASVKYQLDIQGQLKNKSNAIMYPLAEKAQNIFAVYLEKIGSVQLEAQQFLDKNYKSAKESLEKIHDDELAAINKKYSSKAGEGKGDYTEERCAEINTANNKFLEGMAAINNDFNDRFSEQLRQLNIEAMYWSQILAGPAGYKEMIYYERAVFAVSPLLMKSIFIKPCNENEKQKPGKKDLELPAPDCPISFKFKIALAKLTGDCSKFEIEIELEGLVLNLERDFVNKKSTIAFGAGASLEGIPSFIDAGGGGVGTKAQGFIEFGKDGISDIGLRGEASVEGIGTDKGDIKINGKIGINSGVDISTSAAAENIAKALNVF